VSDRDRAVLDNLGGIAGFHVYGGAVFNQQFDRGCIAVTTPGSGHQGGGAAALIHGIHIGAFCEQDADEFDVVGRGSLLEHTHATLVANVHVGALFDEKSRRLGGPIICSGDQQRCAAKLGAGIDLSAFG
jgi:hypothetical protein